MSKDKAITIEDVALALGVSESTVSRAISGKGRVSEETRNRVLNYIKKMNYVPNAMAKGLASSATGNIGIVVTGSHAFMELPFFQYCLEGICESAGAKGYDTMIAMDVFGKNRQLERMIVNRKVDGVILTRTATDDDALKFLLKHDIPFITIGTAENSGIYQVDHDHREACRIFTEGIIKKGCERLLLLYSEKTAYVTRKRIQGFKEALGKKYTSDMILDVSDDSKAMGLVIDGIRKHKYDCIICADDRVCMKLLDRLSVSGLTVPEDIKVASFYGSELLSKNRPSITSLKFDARDLGTKACSMLLNLIDGEEPVKEELLGYEIAEGQSV